MAHMKPSIIKNLSKMKTRYGTWTAVAKELGISYRYVTLIRQGRRVGKSLEILLQIKAKEAP